MERTQSDSDDERPPLPQVPPPPLSPSTTPPPTPATPSPRHSDSPSLNRKNSKGIQAGSLIKTNHHPPPPQKPFVKLGRSFSVKEMSSTSLVDPFLDMLQSRNPLNELNENQNDEFNLDLDNFSRELMSIFEDLDAKIDAHRGTANDVCPALLPKSLRSRELPVAKKMVDSKNYVVNKPTFNCQKHENADLDEGNRFETSFMTKALPCITRPSNVDAFGVKERAIPSPSRKSGDKNVSPVHSKACNNKVQPALNRSSSFSIYSGNETLPKTFLNHGYCRNHQINFKTGCENGGEDRSNTSHILYSSHTIHSQKDRNVVHSSENSPQNLQPQNHKPQKGGFHDFCNRLKQRSSTSRNIYRQYVKQVIDRAPKLDGYDSDVGSVSDAGESFHEKMTAPESFRSSPILESRVEQPKLSDGVPVNIYGTVRKSSQQVMRLGRAFRSIRNIFNVPVTNHNIHQVGTYTKTNSKGEDQDESFNRIDIKSPARTSSSEMHSFSSIATCNDCTLKRRTSFQSLLNVFDGPQVLNSTWKSDVTKEKLRSCFSGDRRESPARKDWVSDRLKEIDVCPTDGTFGGSYGNLASSKRFVSCLEIRLAK